MLFVLYLAAALYGRKKPTEAERSAAMLSFVVLALGMLNQQLPVMLLSSTTLFMAAYLHKAR